MGPFGFVTLMPTKHTGLFSLGIHCLHKTGVVYTVMLSRKGNSRCILSTVVTAAVILVATLIGLLVALTSSASTSTPKSAPLDSLSPAEADALVSVNPTTTGSIRSPTTVQPSPSPSTGLWQILSNMEQGGGEPTAVPMSTTSSPVLTTRQPTKNTAKPTAPPEEEEIEDESSGEDTISTFYGIGDIPYSSTQADILETQMKELPDDAEFVIHVGDLRLSADHLPCRLSEYRDAAYRMSFSHAPVFVILGDNDWTDCPDREEGLRFWKQTFVGFESKHWNHTFAIQRQQNREENFAFVHKGTLFMGLNIIGGNVHSATEWESRLTEQASWSIDLINRYRATTGERVGRVVIFGHANPNNLHRRYFTTLRTYIRGVLGNNMPVLYVNGDKHEWSYDPEFYGQSSWLRIMVSGKGVDPPLRLSVDSASKETDPERAFEIDRML